MASMDRAARERGVEIGNFRAPDIKLFIKDYHHQGTHGGKCSTSSKKRGITVKSWSTIKDVKQKIQQQMDIPPNAQRLFFGPLLTELPNHRTLHDAGIYRSGETLLLDIKGSAAAMSSVTSPSSGSMMPTSLRLSNPSGSISISSSMADSTPKLLRNLVQQARRGFIRGIKPALVVDGSGGTYFMHDVRKVKVAVFKPADEEPYAENNPRGYLPQPGANLTLREGVKPGELCIREVAAFLLDHGGFSGVPMTTLAECYHPAFCNNANSSSLLNSSFTGSSPFNASISNLSLLNLEDRNQDAPRKKKIGSFQEFCKSECTMDDISPSKISVDEIHKIAILDIRIMNADRNSANLLCRRNHDNSLELVPIDHGFCLRTVADVSWMDWCWLDWPQLKQPLSERSKSYIMNLDIEADARLLYERLNIRDMEVIDYFCASSRLLKAGVKAGLTLYDIACLCCRNDDLGELPSSLESLYKMASELAVSAIENGRWHHTAASRAIVEQLQQHQSPSSVASSSTTVHENGVVAGANSKNSSKKQRSGAGSADIQAVLGNTLVQDINIKRDSQNNPGMAQLSSGSDSSPDLDEFEDGILVEEKEDCEEWAASIIADVSMDHGAENNTSLSPLLFESRGESSDLEEDNSGNDGSTSSSSNLSSSPKGFWHIRPGSTPSSRSDSSNQFAYFSDEDSGQSSASCSSSSVVWSPSASADEDFDEDGDDLGKPSNHSYKMNGISQNPSLQGRRPTVTFAVGTMYGHLGDDDDSDDNDDGNNYDNYYDDQDESVSQSISHSAIFHRPIQRESFSGVIRNSGMKRSSSFSELMKSNMRAMSCNNLIGHSSVMNQRQAPAHMMTPTKGYRPKPFTKDYDKFRDYFLKFVDLVIARETTTAAAMIKQSKQER